MNSRLPWFLVVAVPVLLGLALPSYDLGTRALRIWKEQASWNRFLGEGDGRINVQHAGSDMWETMRETPEGKAILADVEKLPHAAVTRIRSASCDNKFLKSAPPPVRAPAYQLPTKLTPADLAMPEQDYRELLKIVKMTRIGTETVEPIERAIEAGSIRFLDFDKGPIAKDKMPDSHAYVDLTAGRVYLDFKQPEGLLVLYLFHELAHLTDKNSQRAVGIRDKLRRDAIMEAEAQVRRSSWRHIKERRNLAAEDFRPEDLVEFARLKEITDEVTATEAFRAEAYALTRGNQFSRELNGLFPGYYARVQVGVNKTDVTHVEVDPKWLVNEMHLPGELLTKWIDGECVEISPSGA